MSSSFTLDAEQDRAVRSRHNVVVAAGAGSGKTRVLTERYVAMVAARESEVARILTLTFTRKAATEMFERVYARLHQLAVSDPAIAAQLERIDDAPISTLDSFCARVVRDCAARFGLPPTIRSDERALAALDSQTALTFLATHTDEGPLADLVAEHDLATVWERLLIPLASRVLNMATPLDFPAIAGAQIAWLEQEFHRWTAAAALDLAYLQEHLPPTPGARKLFEIIVASDRTPEGIGAILDRIAVEQGFRLPFATARSGPEVRAWAEAAQRLLRKKADKERPLGSAYQLRRVQWTLDRSDELHELARTLAAFQEQVFAQRRGAALLSFNEVVRYALRGLTEDLELRQYYKRAFDFIMIDEFQDNNALQRDLLYLLAERLDRASPGVPAAADLDPRKLFFVGDQKQSIYRFRGADVRVFKALSEEVSETLELHTNYRSEPYLIQFFNPFFEAVFRYGHEPYEASFEPLGARDPRAVRPVVELRLVRPAEDPDNEFANELAEAAWVADQIAALIAAQTPVGDGTRTLQYSDIAILMRTTTNQQHYERLLRWRGIPYQSESVRSLFLEAPANDMYTLLQVLLFPEDRTAYAALLRSPFVNLNDDSLIEVLTTAAPPFALSVAEPAVIAITDPVDRERFQRAATNYHALQGMVDRVSHTQLLAHLWYELGYRYAILTHPRYHAFQEHYEYLFQLAHSFAERPLSAFVAEMRCNLGQAERLVEFETHAREAVRVLTIHRAKGLQFPVVFVVGLKTESRSGDRDLFTIRDDLGPCVTLSARSIEDPTVRVLNDFAAPDEPAQTAAELRRLLYVACTRAEQLLYLSSAVPARGKFAAAAAGDEEASEAVVEEDPAEARNLLQIVAAAVGLRLDEFTVHERFAGLLHLGWIEPISAEQLRHPAGAGRRHRDWLTGAAQSATVIRRQPRPIDFSPSAVAAWLSADGRPLAAAPAPTVTDAAPAGAASAGGVASAGGPTDAAATAATDAAARFGTLVHRFIQAALNDWADGSPGSAAPQERRELPPADAAPPRAGSAWWGEWSAAALPPAAWTDALRLVWAFADGPFWHQRAALMPRVHTEVPFLRFIPEADLFFHGRIDLILEYENALEVIDFKTDAQVDPEAHRVQLLLYRDAAADLFARAVAEVNCGIYFLRHRQFEPITGELSQGFYAALTV